MRIATGVRVRRRRLVRRLLPGALLLMLPAAAFGEGAMPRLGAELGIGYGHLSYDVSESILEVDNGFDVTPRAGLIARWTFQAPWAITSGIYYERFGDRMSLVGGPTTMTGENTLEYLTIPARIELTPFASGQMGVSFGPEVGYLLKATREVTQEGVGTLGPSKASATIDEEAGTFDQEGDVTGQFERLDVSVVAGVVWSVPVGSHLGRVEARYAQGLTDTRRSDGLTQKTRGAELTLGLLW